MNDNDIHIDISDALSEKEKVKFTVHTKVNSIDFIFLSFCVFLKTKSSIFQEADFNVTRQHEEFIWLHDRFNENEEYAGLIVGFASNVIPYFLFFFQKLRIHLHHLDLISMHLVLNYKN